jgi:YaaC-like Protein
MVPPIERSGTSLRIRGQQVSFSNWPTKKGKRGYILQPEVLSNSPWDVIDYAIKAKYKSRNPHRNVCISFLEQAKAFYFASETYDDAASPLLLYYSFLNLAKCFVLFNGALSNLDNAEHGLTVKKNSSIFSGASLIAFPATNRHKNIFDLFGRSLGLTPLSSNKSFHVIKHIIPQIVIGHRLWSAASNKASKFVRCQNISFRHDQSNKLIWLRVGVDRDDIRACNLSQATFSKLSGLSIDFRQVTPERSRLAERYVIFEQKSPMAYTRRPSDKLHDLVSDLKARVWPIVRSVPPYRRYYLNLMSPSSRRLHSLLSVYAFAFYLGSVTRYRPFDYEKIKDSSYGMFVAEFIETQGQQFWFQMASEFLKQSVSLPAVPH